MVSVKHITTVCGDWLATSREHKGKPSGTVSQLVDSASGIHTRHSPYYIRTVRQDSKDPLSAAMIAMGIPYEIDVMNPSALVFSFPIKAPEGAICRNDRTAIEQLELWKIYQDHWCEHKPSVTISVDQDEWLDVGAWVYKNFDNISGVSFLPKSEHTYKQAPYQEITEEEYYKFLETYPKNLDWGILGEFEKEDATTSSHELACTAGGCEI
jgi:ribonucleoside-triphosphate reductase (thioredoxin)